MPFCCRCRQELARSAFSSHQLTKKSRVKCKACAAVAPEPACYKPCTSAAFTKAMDSLTRGETRPVDPTRPTIDTLLVLDFEGTCNGEGDRALTRLQQCDLHEIIEWPVVRLDAASGQEVDIFHSYVRPEEGAEAGEARRLTEYCTELTGITQAQVENAPRLAEVVELFVDWLQARGLVEALRAGTTALVAHGEWDLVDQLPTECRRKRVALPACLRESTDLRIPFADTVGGVGTGLGMLAMLDRLQLTPEGRHHCGLDDARNLARVAARLVALGADMAHTHRCAGDDVPPPRTASAAAEGAGGAGGAEGAEGAAGAAVAAACAAAAPACVAAPALANGFSALAVEEPEAGESTDEASPARGMGAPLASLPGGAAPKMQLLRGRGKSVRETDWSCACGGSTFGSRPRCFRCGALRPGVTEEQAARATTRRERKPGDWVRSGAAKG
eukprot:Transcript_9987.p1 GENE.Transcript_9987~~Transcript_9987.p1  ORF type:complete len:445 (+),score=98.91 Transcript_9987:83-1417(+)